MLVLASMANAVVTLMIVPEEPDADTKHIAKVAEEKIDAFVGKHMQKHIKVEPFVFGLKKIEIQFMMNEDLGSPDSVAEEVAAIDGVKSAEVTNVTRAMG